MKIHVLWMCLLLISLSLFSKESKNHLMVEICDNGIDDDGDNLIDLNDTDCDCIRDEPESLIPNPSFEEQNCCPSGRSQLGCAVDWIQASEPTTDYIHTCGWLGWDNIDAPMPFPDGDGIIGFRDGRNIQGNAERNWKEYVGACLISPLKAGTEYTFEFHVGFVNTQISPAINITFFGTENCDFLPFGIGNAGLGCPTNGPNWVQLASTRVSGDGWVRATIRVQPDTDINAIAIGPSCAQITSSVNLYYFFDNLVLAESTLFPKNVLGVGNSCTDGFELMVDEEMGATYQWYESGIAIVGETSPFYRPLLIDGDYSVMQFLDGQCNLSNAYSYRVNEEFTMISETICEDEKFDFGDVALSLDGSYLDTIKTVDGCDSILFLELKVLGSTKDSIYKKIFPGDEYKVENFSFSDEGIYDFTLQSKEGCDSLILLDLDHYKFYVPNTFSPNEDGVNDIFEVFIEDADLLINRIIIYDRWGNQVFEGGFSFEKSTEFWDGSFDGRKVDEGVYTYIIEFGIGLEVSKMISGDITIVL